MIWRLLFAALLTLPSVGSAQVVRIKDLGAFEGVRTNQLVGYGVVVGLAGTGDDNLAYLTQAMAGVTARLGLTLPPGVSPALKNAAAVMVTAELSPMARPGQRVDVTVSAIGRARSLRGGTLVLAPLMGADGQIYAMAQGSLAVGGLGVSAADGSQASVNIPSVGRIAGGASVERSVVSQTPAALRFNLAANDLSTAQRVATAISEQLPGVSAVAADGVTIAISPGSFAGDTAALMARIEGLSVTPDAAPARVIVNARTGTVVINGAVRIAAAAVSHGRLTVEVGETPLVSQPDALSRGRTATASDSTIAVTERGSPMFEIAGASLSEIVKAINDVGAAPSDLVAILEALHQAGALRAELVVL